MKKIIILTFCFLIVSFLVSAAPPTPRTFWSQNGNSKLDGQPVPIGTVITTYDPDGVLCGQFTITTEGQFSFDCAGDDPDTSGIDEGGEPGDIITFYMDGILATITGGSAEWQSGFQEVDIEATPPHVDFTSPTPGNGTTINTDYTTINVTVNKNVSSCILDWSILSWGNNWNSDSEVAEGLGNVGGYSHPAVFQKDSAWYLIAGEGDGYFNGYNWTGTTWQSDSNIASGLLNVNSTSSPTVFQKDSTWYLISGYDDGHFNGYNWTGSTWQSDPNIASGLVDVDHVSKPTVFQKDSAWYLIAGESEGMFYGYNWTGSTWQSDPNIVSGLVYAGQGSSPDVFQKDSTWYLISGKQEGDFNGYNWTGTTWVNDSNIVSGLGNVGSKSTPAVFQKDSAWYLISGEQDGDFNGYHRTLIETHTMDIHNADANTWANYTITGLEEETYFYYAWCNDTVGNSNETEERILYVDTTICVDNDGDGYGVCPNCGIANGCTYDGDDCDDDPGQCGVNCNPGITNESTVSCSDGYDNDCDGSIDCLDSDCYGQTGPNGDNCCNDPVADCAQDDCVIETCGGDKECEYADRAQGATDECSTCEECNVAGGDCAGITANDGKGCIDDCTSCVAGSCDDRLAGATDECSTCEECNVAGGDCAGITANDGKDCSNDCDSCVAGTCTTRDTDDNTEVVTTCYYCNGTNTASQPYSGNDGVNCIDDCTACVAGFCNDRLGCATDECAAGEYCDAAGGDCTDPNDNSASGENVCEICISYQHNYGETWLFEGGTPYCCNNDANEYYITDGIGPDACCDTESENCVDSEGVCRTEWGTETTCDDGIDNDCDGSTDLDDTDCQPCTPGETRNCPKQDGVCTGCQEVCNISGQWPGCDDVTYLDYNASYENPEASCDSLDNDCDGTVDGGCNLVDDDKVECPGAMFTNIQDAVDFATAGDTIIVCAGTYSPSSRILIDKGITLIGDINTPGNVIIDCSGMGNPKMISVDTDNVKIKGFKVMYGNDYPNLWSNAGIGVGLNPSHPGIENVEITNCEFWDNAKGVFLISTKNCLVENNYFRTTRDETPDNFNDPRTWNGDGVHIFWNTEAYPPTGNIVRHNIMDNVRVGVMLNGDYFRENATNTWDFSGTIIENNSMTDVWIAGIILQVASGTSSSPINVKDNYINNSIGPREGDEINEHGLISVAGDYANIDNNTLINSHEHGMWIDGSHHTVTNNSIISNSMDGVHVGHYKEVETAYWELRNLDREDISINYNNIYNNGDEGVDGIQADSVINAENNYWGAANGPDSPYNAGSGDKASDNVDVCPFWDSWPGGSSTLCDADGDGYRTDVDCDDNNPDVNPGATEVCNGIDDNCVDGIDETGDALCDDSLYCNGAETCDGANGCHAGAAVNCDDANECTDDICNEDLDQCENPGLPSGTGCGSARYCPDDACNGFFAEFYPIDGHDECDGAGTCVEYSCALENSYCTDNNNTDGVNTIECGAPCDQDIDCTDVYCTESSHKTYPDGECKNDCSCTGAGHPVCIVESCGAECDEDTDCSCPTDYCEGTALVDYPDDGRCGTAGSEGCLCQVDTGSGGDCEPTLVPDAPGCEIACYNDGDCDDTNVCTDDACINPGTQVSYCDYTDNTDPCDDGLFCTVNDVCSGGQCTGGDARDCSDSIGCTDDSCNETTDSCDHNPNDGLCSADTVCADYYCDVTSDCQVNYEPDTTECRAAAGVCDIAETCTGSSADCPVDDKSIAECRTATSDCDIAEICDGISNDCPADAKQPAGTQCGEARNCPPDACNVFIAQFYPDDGHDTCDGIGNCNVYSCSMENSYCTDNDAGDGVNGLTCGAECDQDEDCDDEDPATMDRCIAGCTCTNTREDCTNGIDDDGDGDVDCADSDCAGENGPGGVICCQVNDDCNPLDDDCADGVCGLSNNECNQQIESAGTECRAAAGDCDIAEECTGEDAACPADDYKSAGTECRAAAGDCDVVEQCTGANANCPADAYEPIGTDCGICAECDGTGTCVYDETQDNDCSCPDDGCTDNNSDGIIDAWNDYEVAECEAIYTCNDCGPTITEPDVQCKTVMKTPIDKGYYTMFSLPLVPETGKTFNDIQSGCTFTPNVTNGITYWNPDTSSYDVFLDGNAILFPGQGYFSTQTNDCEIELEGYRFTIDYVGYLGSDDIKNGWNLIGAPSSKINDFDTAEGTCSVVSGPWGYDAPSQQYTRTPILNPGKAYFIKSTNDCNLG
ncbi:MAG: hypothetical protein KAU20_07945 [Nanoarchaeota archaeon]|nr:hypothetical protein [Nanoarchaeota archaeon]